MKSALVSAAALALLCGCGQMSVSNFQKSEHSGVKENKLAFVLVYPNGKNRDLSALAPVIGADKDLQSAMVEACDLSPDFKISAVPPPVIPVFATLGKLIFDLFMDDQVRQLEGLKKAAQGSYSDKQQMAGGELRKQTCALAVRYKEKETDYGLVALLKLVKQSDNRSFVLEPAYVRAKNAVVVTEKPSDNKPATIGISVAVSVKGITKQKSGSLGLQQIGEGVVSVPKLALGPNSPAVKCEPKPRCPTSDLIPYPEAAGEVVSVALSVAEVGKISIDFDQSIAETKAIKEAIGPVLKDSIKELLK